MGGGVTRSMDGGILGAWGWEEDLDGVLQLLLLLLLLVHLLLVIDALLGKDLELYVDETDFGDWRLQ